MAYINKEKSAEIRKKLKAEFPDFKFSVTIDNYISLYCCIMEAPIAFTEGTYETLNHHHLEQYKYSNVLERIYDICNEGNHDNSDSMTDYFDVGWYFDLSVGKYDRPFKLVENKSGTDWENFNKAKKETKEDMQPSSTDFLSLFDNIEVSTEQTISEDDKAYCEKLQTYLDDTLKQLTVWYRYLLEASVLELEENDYYSRNEKGEVRKKAYYNENDIDAFKSCWFTPLYDLRHIEELRLKALRIFEQKIINYFNSTYCLRMDRPDVFQDTEFTYQPKYTEVVDCVIRYLDGETFKQKADNYIISDFRNCVRSPELKGPTLVLQSMVWTSWYSSYLDTDTEKKLEKLCKALGYFEDGSPHYDMKSVVIDLDTNNPRFNEYYDLRTTKAISMKFYQNRRLDIKFSDKQTALDFFNFYNLNNI